MNAIAEPTDCTVEHADCVERGLRAAWRKETGLVLARGSAWTLACLAVLVIVDLAVDWWLDLPAYFRLTLLLVNLAVLAVVVRRRLLCDLRRYRPVELALRVEKASAGTSGLLVSSVQFQNGDAPLYGTSPELIEAVCRQAAQRARTIDFSRIADSRRLRPALAAAAAILAVVVAFGLWQPECFRILAHRMLNPWSAAMYPTRTTIESVSGDLIVHQGEPIRLQASVAGEIPDSGQLHVRFKGLSWESVLLERQDPADFNYLVPHGSEDFEYYFALGDARSKRFQVTVAHPPRITETAIELKYPAYTKLAADEVHTMNLRFPEGTAVRWQLRLDRPVVAAEMMLEDKAAHRLDLDSTGQIVTLEQKPEASSSYSLRFRWKLGDRECVDQDARHYLQVIPDLDPRAGMIRPFEDGKATLSKVVDLAFWAKDDYGLDQAWLVYSLNDGSEQRWPLGSLEGNASIDDRALSWPVAKVIGNLKEGDLVTFAVEVTDRRAGPGHRGRSPSRRLQFVSPQEYLSYSLGRQRKYLGQLRPLYLQEMEAHAHLGPLTAGDAPARPAGRSSDASVKEQKP